MSFEFSLFVHNTLYALFISLWPLLYPLCSFIQFCRSNKISHTSFEINDVALFMPTGRSYKKRGEDITTKHPIYLAFHSHCPHRYLSHGSVSTYISGTSSSPPDYVLGRIVFVEECMNEAEGGKKNEYCVPPSVKYWVLTVEVIKAP